MGRQSLTEGWPKAGARAAARRNVPWCAGRELARHTPRLTSLGASSPSICNVDKRLDFTPPVPNPLRQPTISPPAFQPVGTPNQNVFLHRQSPALPPSSRGSPSLVDAKIKPADDPLNSSIVTVKGGLPIVMPASDDDLLASAGLAAVQPGVLASRDQQSGL